ncbi:MAG TPA: MinD/ParA family protein [Pseudolysinimonas sp.]|nr:MinD/ParA family protein [Pseudolysinimonas sp.]
MTAQIEPYDFVLDDVPVPPQLVVGDTMSIEIVPAAAREAGQQHQAQAALELESAAPPLPVEPRPASRYGRRYVDPSTRADDFVYEPYLTPRPGARPAPEGFWREYVYGVTLGLVNLGDSRAVRARKALQSRIGRPLPAGAHHVPVISRHGGVGTTTVTTLLGLALAAERDDALAIDAHPDRGVLADRLTADVLPVRTAAPRVGTHEGVVLTDGASGERMRAALRAAESVVVVSGGTSEQARLASETVTWLHENELADLADNAVVAINTATPGTRYESLDAIEAHFQARVRDVVRIPYDEELAAGAPVRFGALRPDTVEAARELAAKVIDGLPQ